MGGSMFPVVHKIAPSVTRYALSHVCTILVLVPCRSANGTRSCLVHKLHALFAQTAIVELIVGVCTSIAGVLDIVCEVVRNRLCDGGTRRSPQR